MGLLALIAAIAIPIGIFVSFYTWMIGGFLVIVGGFAAISAGVIFAVDRFSSML
jgi:hypothetical protein